MPHLNRFQKEFGSEKLAIFSIGNLRDNKGVKDYVVTQGLKGAEPLFHVLKDGWKVYRDYKGRGTPNTFIIDKQGRVRFIHRAYNPGMEKTMQREIEVLLSESA